MLDTEQTEKTKRITQSLHEAIKKGGIKTLALYSNIFNQSDCLNAAEIAITHCNWEAAKKFLEAHEDFGSLLSSQETQQQMARMLIHAVSNHQKKTGIAFIGKRRQSLYCPTRVFTFGMGTCSRRYFF